jgi:hypothetical protein
MRCTPVTRLVQRFRAPPNCRYSLDERRIRGCSTSPPETRPLRPSFKPLALIALVCLAHSHAARAAADTISTDRPDYVESSDVVGKGRVQIEAGFQSERDSSDGVKTRTRTTPTLLRLGFNDSTEFRVETDGLTLQRSDDSTQGTSSNARGWSDVSLGVKWRVQEGDEEKGTPGMAWLLHADIDSGNSAFRGQGIRPSLRFVAEWDLPHEMSIGVMPGVVLDRNEGGKRFASGIFAVTLGKSWTPVWRTYVEVAGQQLASKSDGGSIVTFDTGVTYLVNDSLQLDLSLSRGLTPESPDFSWGVGASIRF